MNKKRLKELVEKNNEIHMEDDYAQKEIWDEMISILSQKLDETIQYLDGASKEEIYYISSVYDDLSEIFKSEELIDCMEKNAHRTGVDCSVNIQCAKDVMKN